MNTNTAAVQTTSTSRRSLRRVLSATVATASVAVVGIGGMSTADASAAGVAPGIRYVGTTGAAPSSVSASALPAHSTV